MNRALLLLLSVVTFNLFGKVFPPEMLKTETPTDLQNQASLPPGILPTPQFQNSRNPQVMMDTVDPVIVCPLSETFILQPGKCDTVLNYTVTATDDQGTAIIIQLSGQPSGSVFQVGVNTLTFLATDLSGNTATCSFTLTVEDEAVQLLTCDIMLTVELNANCTETLLPQEALDGGPYGCWDRYIVEVDKLAPFGNGPWLPAVFNANDVGKTYQDRVTDSETGNKCWGNVTILDETPPVLVCQEITVSCAEENLSPAFLKDSLGIAAAMPQVNDACGSISFLSHVDFQFPYFCDTTFTKIVNRRWQANDGSGNSSTCIQQIKLHRHTSDELQMPPDMTLNCPGENLSPSFTGEPFLIFNGRRYGLVNSSICEVSAFYEDFPTALPCGDIQIKRLWELLDFCTGEESGPFEQNIFVIDESAPSVACPASLLITLNADTCHGLVDLPDPVLDDACSQVASFQAFWQEDGLSEVLLGSLADFMGNDTTDFDTLGVMGSAVFPVGTTMVTYVIEDSCGNIGDCSFNLTVADMVPPVARCDTFSTLQLLPNGMLAVQASTLNNGSNDDCAPLSFKARMLNPNICQNDTFWVDTLNFCCTMVNDTVDAVLRVYDIPMPTGAVSTSFGNGHFSDCALKIFITDPNPPTCIAPPNVVTDCENFDPTLPYGNIGPTSCAVDSVSIETDYALFDTACSRGTVSRIFKVFDNLVNVGTCTQTISVNYLQDYFVKFPNDQIVTACNGTNNYGEPIFFGQNCEDFDVTYTDEIFNVVPDACYKIERTWKISNRCTYDPEKPITHIPNPNPNATTNHPDNLPGPTVSACGALPPWAPTNVKINPTDPTPTNYCIFWSDTANGYDYRQIIKIIDGQAPTGTYAIPTCANQNWETPNNTQLWNEMYWWDNEIGSHDLCEEPTVLSIAGIDACSGSNINIEYLLFLDLDGDGIMETVVNSVNVGAVGLGWNNVLYNNLNTPNFMGGTPRAFDGRPVPSNQKFGFAIEETVLGNTKTAFVRWNTQQIQNSFIPPELPHGTHKIKWFVTDNCGNNREYEYTFTVKDCKTPTVVCLSGLTIDMLPTGSVLLHASDFLQYTEDNCTPVDQIKIGIRKCGTGTGFPVGGDGNPIQSVIFDCTELGTNCIELWAMDKSGNADYCETYVIALDNQNNCNGVGGVFGWIRTELGEGVEDVFIEIVDNNPFLPPPFLLNPTDSLGYFSSPPFPIGSNFFLLPEKDDNPLNGVTTYDLVLISKHILGTEPLNSPYKMISADANRSGSVTTFDIVEFRKLILGIYAELPNNSSWRFVDSSFVFPSPNNPFQVGFPDTIPLSTPPPYNFVGMKIGDVNNTAIANFRPLAEERFSGTVFFDIQDREVLVGEILEIKLSASELLEGCQFTLETDGLEVLEIIPGKNMSKENFANFPKNSLLTMAWEAGGQAEFSLKVRAQKSGSLREMLQISNLITKAEAYSTPRSLAGTPNTKSRIAIRFGLGDSVFELFQNQPNPFAEKTAITFQIPEASSATLTIFDGSGRLLWSGSGDWLAGLNTVEVDLTGLSTAGVLYYKLETPDQSAVRKMLRY